MSNGQICESAFRGNDWVKNKASGTFSISLEYKVEWHAPKSKSG